MLACLCHILAMIDDTFAEAAEVIDFIADVVFAIISSCMIAQVPFCFVHFFYFLYVS